MRVIILSGKEVTEYDLMCPDCGANMALRQSKFGYFYGCQDFYLEGCPGRISASDDGTPNELPSDQHTKHARVMAQESFERLWKSGKMTEREAFDWLCKTMECSRAEAYIVNFEIPQCEKLIRNVEKKLRGWELQWGQR